MKKFLFCSLLATAVALSGSAFAKDAPAAGAGETKAKVNMFIGEITAVDATAMTLSVKHGKDGDPKAFKVAADAKIATADNKDAKLADLKVGDKVRVAYDEAGGVLTAKKIGPAPARTSAKTTKPKAE